jgi:hypothetical protein
MSHADLEYGVLDVQAVKRLAQMAIDTTQDVRRLHTALQAMVEIDKANDCAEFERKLGLCLMDTLKLSSARLYKVNGAAKTLESVSEPRAITSWQSPGPEGAHSVAAWCVSSQITSLQMQPISSLHLTTCMPQCPWHSSAMHERR